MVMVFIGLCIALVVALTVMNILYIHNIRGYVNLVRRGMVRVKIRYQQDKTEKVLRGWAYKVDLGSILNNPVSQSSSFVKVYERGYKEVVIAFSMVKKLEILEESYFSVIFVRRAYL